MNATGIQGSNSLVVIESIVNGSTDVRGKVIIEDTSQAQALYTNLQSNAGSLPNFNVITVTSIQANGFDPTPQPQPEPPVIFP